jgi:hypothetical protein
MFIDYRKLSGDDEAFLLKKIVQNNESTLLIFSLKNQ